MQCAAVKKNLIRVVVDEEIDFCFTSPVTGSGNVDKHLGVERDAVEEFIAKSGAVDDLQLKSVNPDSDSEKNQEVNVRRSEVVRRFDSVTPLSESHTELYECRNLTSLNDRYDILLFERRLRKAERISDVQNSLLQIAVEEEIMVSRSLSRKRKKNDTLETRQKKTNVDVAGNIQDVRTSPRKRKCIEKDVSHSINESLTKPVSEMTFKKKAKKKLEGRVEHIKRPQSESLDQEKQACERTVINDSKNICKERGRKMERHCQITSKDTRSNKMTLSSSGVSKSTENDKSKQYKSSSTSEKLSESEVRTKMFDSMAYTIVELEDIAPVLHSYSSSKTDRSVSVTRLVDGLQNTVEKQTLTVRKTRSLSRARDPVVNEKYFHSPQKGQSTKSTDSHKKSEQSGTQQLPFCKSKWKQRNKTVQLIDSTEAKTNRLRNDVEIITPGGKAKYQHESINKAQNEWSPVSGSLSEEEFSASDDEDIKPPIFLCRCCDAEFSSRFDLHEHLVDFHRISKCTAVLPLAPSETDTSSLDSSFEHESAVDERVSIKRKRKKSVSFSVRRTDANTQITDAVTPDNPVTEEVSSSNIHLQSDKRIEERMAKDFNLKEVSVSVKRCEFNPKIQSSYTFNTNGHSDDKLVHSVLDSAKRDNILIEKPDNLLGRTTVEICPYDDDPCTSRESLFMADSMSPGMKEKNQNAEICSVHTVEIYESPETEILTDNEMTDVEDNDSLPESRKDCLRTETLSEDDESLTLHTGKTVLGKNTGNSSRIPDIGKTLLGKTMKTKSYSEKSVDKAGSPVPARRTRSSSRSRNFSGSLETNKCQNIQSHYSDKDTADNSVPHTMTGKRNGKTDVEKVFEKSKRTNLFQVKTIDNADSSVPASRTRSRSRSRHLSGSLETIIYKNFQSDCKDDNKVDSSVKIKRTSSRSKSSRSRHLSGDKDPSVTNNSQSFQSKLKDKEVNSGSFSGNLTVENNVTEPEYSCPIEASPNSRSPNKKQFTKELEVCLKEFKQGKEFVAELFSSEKENLNVGTISDKIEPDLDTVSEMNEAKDEIQMPSTRDSSSILRSFGRSSQEVVQVEGMEGNLLNEQESTNSESPYSEKRAVVCNKEQTGSEKRDTSVSVSDNLASVFSEEDKLPAEKNIELDGNINILPANHLLVENSHRSVEYEGSMFGKQTSSVSPSLVSSFNLHSQNSPNGLKTGEVKVQNGSCKTNSQDTVIEESVENKKVKGRKADGLKAKNENLNLTNKMLPKCNETAISMLHNKHNLTKNCKIGKDINDNDQIRITSVCQEKTDSEKSTDDYYAVDIAVSPHTEESKNQETVKIITNQCASEDETRSSADCNNISISGKVTVSKQITAESAVTVEDELLKQFLELEGFCQNKICNVEFLDSEIDSNLLNDELANGYNEGLSFMKMLLYLGKLDISKYKNSGDRSKCDKCNIDGNLSETKVHRYNSERSKNSSKTNIGRESDSFVSLSSESTSKEKFGKAFIQQGNHVQNELESNNLSSSDSVREQQNRFNFLKKRRKLMDSVCPKKSKVNSKTHKDDTERAANITNLDFESKGDCVEINPNLANSDTSSVICEPKEIQTCGGGPPKSNIPTHSDSYSSDMKNKLNKTESFHETSIKENSDTNSQYVCSQEEAKNNKSIRIRLKRKRKRSCCDGEDSTNILEIPDTEVGRKTTIPDAKLLSDNSVNEVEMISKKEDHSGKKSNAPVAKHRKMEKEHISKKQDKKANISVKDKANRTSSTALENMNAIFNKLMPVLKLKRIPFVKKLEIDGLHLKFKGTKSKPFWKIKHCQTNLMHEKATVEIPNEKGKANKCSTEKRMDKGHKSDNNVQSKKANRTVHVLKFNDENLTEMSPSIVSVDSQSNDLVIDTVTSAGKNTSPSKQKDKKSDRLQQANDSKYKADESDVTVKQDSKKRKEGNVSKHRKKSKILKDDDTSTCHLSHGNKLIVKIQTKKLKKEAPLTEFDRALLNSGKLRKEKLKQTKKASSFSRQKSSDSNESQPESNREVLFGKSNKNKNVREDSVPLLIKSKIAQKIVHNDQKEKHIKEQEIPEFLPVTDLESMHLPPLLSSSSVTDSNVNKYPALSPSPKQSNKTFRPLSHLKKSLESLGNIKDLIKNNPKSVKLKDILSDSLPEFKNPFEATSFKLLNSSGPGSGDSFSTMNGEVIFNEVQSPQSSNSFQTKFHNSVFNENSSVQKDRSTRLRGNEEKTSLACSTPSQVPVNVHSRLKSPDQLTDSAFSSPRSFESSFLSPKSGTCMLNKLYEKPKLLSSTPADTNTFNRRSFHTNLSQVKEGFRAEKLFPFDAVDGHFPDLSGVEAEDGNNTHINGIELNETAEHDRTWHYNEVSNAGGNSESLEIYSAEASGINISSPSMKLSETQTKETIVWLKNKQAEQEASEKPNNKHTEKKALEKPPSKNVKDIRLEKDQKTAERKYKPKLKRLDVKHADHVAAEPSFLDSEKFVDEKCVEAIGKNFERQNSELLSGEIDKDFSYSEEKELNDNATNARTEESVAKDHVNKPNSDTESLLADFQATLYENDTVGDNASGLASDLLTSCTDQYLTADDTGLETDFHQIAKQAVDDVFSNVSSQNCNDNYTPGDGDITFLAGSVSQENGSAEIQNLQTSNLQHNSQKLKYVDDLTCNSSQEMVENCDKSQLTAVVNTSDTEGFEHPGDEKQVESDFCFGPAHNATVDGEDNDTETVETESQSDTLLDDGDTEDLSDESCNVSVDLADDDDDVEERIDVLSLYASDDASFLDEDEDDGIVKMGVTDAKKSDSPQLKSNLEASSSLSSEVKLEDNDEVVMDIETPSSPSHGTNMPIEVNTVTPQQRQLMKDMIPSGYCFYFHTSGNCNVGAKCRYNHNQPSQETMLKHCKNRMEQLSRTGELDRALALFEKVTATDCVPPQLVLYMFSECRLSGNVNCYILVKYMFENGFLTADIINEFIYMCGSNASNCVPVLWEVFQRMVNLNIQPANDAMFILLRTFSDCEAWEWLWEVMLYCNEAENFNMPVFCQDRALRAMLQQPSRYFNYAVQWLMSSSVDRLQKLDKQLLQELFQLCSKTGETNLPKALKQILMTDRHTPRPRTPATPYSNDGEAELCEENDETVRGWINSFHGLQYSKNWDYLGELYVKRSTIYCPIPVTYINKIVEILRNNDCIEEVFADFLACAFKRYETESRDNENVRLDMKGLAVIGNSLLKLSAETQKWQAGYQILCHMVSYNIDYLKYCGQYRHIASVAMEICLQCCQPDSALQILKETKEDNFGFSFVRSLFPRLFQQLMVELKFQDCYYVLSVAFKAAYGNNGHHQQDVNNTSVKECTCKLIVECLHQGDVPTAVKTFQLCLDYSFPFLLDILMTRSLLVACLEMRYGDVAQNVYNWLLSTNDYPLQRIEKPRQIIIPLWMSCQEIHLVIKEYLNWLYNVLCDALLENRRPTQADLQLCVRLAGHPITNRQQVPFLSGIPLSVVGAQKMVLDVLTSRLVPGVNAMIQLDGVIKLEPATLARWLCETDKKNRRQGLVFMQPFLPRPGMNNNMLRGRGGYHRISRPRIPR